LNRQEIDKRLVDDAVRVMAASGEEPAKGIFHGPGDRRVDVAFGGGEVDDVFPAKEARHFYAFWENSVQHSHSCFRAVDLPGDLIAQEVVFLRDTMLPVNRFQLV